MLSLCRRASTGPAAPRLIPWRNLTGGLKCQLSRQWLELCAEVLWRVLVFWAAIASSSAYSDSM